MYSLIANIAQEYGILGRENLATKILAGILNRSFRQHLLPHLRAFLSSRFQVELPERLLFDPQRAGQESLGIPDLWVFDYDNATKPILIIECKFGARLTPHQQGNYLKELGQGAVLLFVVPAGRRDLIRQELVSKTQAIAKDEGHSALFVVDGKHFAVTTWDELLSAIAADLNTLDGCPESSTFRSDLDQLKRFCEVTEKEIFVPLTETQIEGLDFLNLIRQLKWLTSNIIQQCLNLSIVKPDKKDKKGNTKIRAHDDAHSIFFGQNVALGGVFIWMGFWPLAWQELGESPLWITPDERGPEVDRLARRLQDRCIKVFRDQDLGGDFYDLVIPIPLTPGAAQDEAVDSACEFLLQVKEALSDAP